PGLGHGPVLTCGDRIERHGVCRCGMHEYRSREFGHMHGDESRMSDNPFFEAWDTPFGMPPFDRIRPEHFPPAFDRGMADQLEEIAAITATAWPPSFADTIEAVEKSGRLLDRVGRVFSNLDASDTNPALEAIARKVAPKLAHHQTRIALDPELFA